MEYRDYYETLGVAKTATDEEIRAAFRKKAKEFHPDRNKSKDAEEQFKQINEAYEVLKDKEKRARYDQLGASYKQWEQSGGNAQNYNWSDWFGGGQSTGGFDFSDFTTGGGEGFSDFFSQIFGGGFGGAQTYRTRSGGRGNPHVQFTEYGGSRPQQRAQEVEVSISLDEAFHGTERRITFSDQNISASIPAGAKNGTKIRLPKAFNSNGVKMDVILKVNVPEKEGVYERKDDDLYVDTPVDLYTAVLGGEVMIEGKDGKFMLTIPAGTQNDKLFRLPGKGMPKMNQGGSRGDLYARVKVSVPRNLNEKQRKLFEELRNT